MDLFPPFVAVMVGAATSFFGGSLILNLLEKKAPGKARSSVRPDKRRSLKP